MNVPIYRSEWADSYPRDIQGYRYSFEPIAYRAHTTGDGLLMGSVYPSGDEPFAVLVAPDGSYVSKTVGGDIALFIPGHASGLSAEESYKAAAVTGRGRQIDYYGLTLAR